MTEDRIRPESDGEVDSLVTRTYKEVASELTPEHLNRAVMKQAADAVRPRYLRSVSWTRPMAWAATVTLCIALVLEVTNAPVPEISDVVLPSGRLDAPAPNPKRRRTRRGRRRHDDAPPRGGGTRGAR
jgi:hypothetical protein